ncbi:MAG: RagB/SusD family nutrient uptake outer membrane protein [Bacteroidetes bacterium]|nr:RagB/SusD family nutrient uptake outer membrane protein [Bacteroidota bacterium]
MKKYVLILSIVALAVSSCEKKSLELNNPNEPTPELSLLTESGLKNFSLGLLLKQLANVPDEGTTNIFFIAMANHSIMGDEGYVPYGNYAFRWVNQVNRITLPSGQVVTNPNGVDQKTQLQGFNSRDAGQRNAFQYEWSSCYYMIAQCNQILLSLDNAGLQLSGDAETKKNTFKAWALWWKGYCYSRIGSMYLAGIITNDPGKTNDNFVSREAIMAEANTVLAECEATLKLISENDSYDEVMEAIVASFDDNKKIVAPDMWIRQIHSLQARNLLVNQKVKTMDASNWQAVLDLANTGIQQGDNIFKFGMDPSGTNDVSLGNYHPYAFIGEVVQFEFVSERLIQDFKPGDNRFTGKFVQFDVPKVNERGRGLQFGTRWNPVYIEDGGKYATAANQGLVPWACSYEENELMQAEALIHLNKIDEGLAHVDAVRAYQNSGLPNVSGTGLNQTQALEEFRKERRVGLFLWGTAFYDARRWGVTEPAAQGGGRTGGIVMVPGDLLVPAQASAAPVPCFLEYNYLDYWDVPQNELDFNMPGPGSVPVKN